jgi:hypothetical protein
MKRKYLKHSMCFVLFLLFFSYSNLPGEEKEQMTEIQIFDCNDKKLTPDDSTLAKEWEEYAQTVLNLINKYKDPNKNCLPLEWLKKINSNKTLRIDFVCDPKWPNCGVGLGRIGNEPAKLLIPEDYESRDPHGKKECGCEEALIIHEMIHAYVGISGRKEPDHSRMQVCTIECTKDLDNCKKFKPLPPEEDCECK